MLSVQVIVNHGCRNNTFLMVLSLTHVGGRPSLRCHSRLSEGVLALGGSIVTVALSRRLRTITVDFNVLPCHSEDPSPPPAATCD